MRLNNLQLNNYRNYESLELSFDKNLVIFLGENAQGKTNVLESIYVLAMTKSHRTTSEQELIRWDTAGAQVSGAVSRGHSTIPLELFLTKKGRKTKVNHIEQKKLSSYIGQLNVILFAPEDLSLVKGSPQVRRKFIDMEIGQIDPIYLYDLVQYQSVLKQRNQYLKQLFEKKQNDELYLTVLTEQLIEFGSKIIFARQRFVKRLAFWANQLHQKISDEKEVLQIEYLSSVGTVSASLEQVQQQFKDALDQVKTREKMRQISLGVHTEMISTF